MESLLLALTLVILAPCIYRTSVTSRHRTAIEEQIRKSCQAEAAEQARLYRAELIALQAMTTSQARTIGTLERERRSFETREEDLTVRCAIYKQERNALKGRLEEAMFDTIAVEKAGSKLRRTWRSRTPNSST
jgi:hypothetical protein